MNIRTVSQIVTAQEVTEGAGVKVFRSLGTAALKNLDPFLMLDNFSTDNPDDYLAGFPMHPHRGFNTFTYMLDGLMQHEDSMGNKGMLEPGGAQWMKAASGIIHSEMPQQISGMMHGFQLWVNLPANKKMSTPSYQEIKQNAIPQIDIGSISIKLLAGRYDNNIGPVVDPETDTHFLDIALKSDTAFDYSVNQNYQAFIYVFKGTVHVKDTTIDQQKLAVLTNGDKITLTSCNESVRFLLICGKPIGEPIVQHGPFVMNTRREIEQAVTDFRNGELVRKKAGMQETR